MTSRLEIVRAQTADAPAILAVQKAAYAREAELYDDWQIPPLVETDAEVARDIDRMVVLTAVVQGVIVGSVRGEQQGGTCIVGRLSVRPDLQGRGIGSALLDAIEGRFAGARFELFTGHKSASNIRLYEAHGYRTFKTEEVHPGLSLVYMHKPG